MTYVPSGWATAYDIDFSTLATDGTTVMANGVNVIDAKNWNVQNSENSDEFRVVNLSGLVIDPNATNSTMTNGTRSGPNVSIKLRDVLKALLVGEDPEIRVTAFFTSTGLDTNTETLLFGIERFQSTKQGFWAAKVFNGTLQYNLRRQYNDVTTDLDVTSLLAGTENVFQFRMKSPYECQVFAGTAIGHVLPAASAMKPIGVMNNPSTVGLGAIVPLMTDFSFVFGCFPNNTLDALRGTLVRFKVEYRR